MKNADFSFLFRYNKRYAKAGFSTKFVECMSFGVPMICNRIGGTDSIIEDNVDGFVLENIDDGNLDIFLKKLYLLDKRKILNMKKAAFAKAQKMFTPENHKNDLKEFLDNL